MQILQGTQAFRNLAHAWIEVSLHCRQRATKYDGSRVGNQWCHSHRVAMMAVIKTMRPMWLLGIHNASEFPEHHHTTKFHTLLTLLAYSHSSFLLLAHSRAGKV